MLQSRFVKEIKVLAIIVLPYFMSFSLLAQPDCRSIIGSNIKPIGKTPVSWGVELSGAGAVMNDRTIANWSLYGGLDYSIKNHQLYFEGAYKGWYNSAKNPDGEDPRTDYPDYNRPQPKHWGMRELFYQYGKQNSFIKAGVQSFKSPDYFMLDERMLGVNAVKTLGSFKLNASAGTVAQGLARFQDVCGNRHIYNIIHRSRYNFVGEKPGETNFGALFINWNPGSTTVVNKHSADEFETFDEFNDNDFSLGEFDMQSKKSAFSLSEAGMFFYEEFGKGFHEFKYYSGIYSTIELPLGLMLKGQITNQYILNDRAISFWFLLQKTITWNSGTLSQISANYFEITEIDEGASFYPAFSNLFLGEVMRLDAIDLPLVSASIKHQFKGKWKPDFQLKAVQQLKGNKSGEIDLLIGVKPNRRLRATGIFSYMHSELLEIDYLMAKLEMRIAF